MTKIQSLSELESVVGKQPKAVMMKSIDALDGHCERILRHSTFAILGYRERSGRARARVVGAQAGFAKMLDSNRLAFQAQIEDLAPEFGLSMMFHIPGVGETLRVNGRLDAEEDQIVLGVQEAFVHCAKAILRSDFWDARRREADPECRLAAVSQREAHDLLSTSPYLLLASWNAQGDADVSPKGDSSGFLRESDQGQLAVPDRPGNRRCDTFRNVIQEPRVALLAMVPGDFRVVELSGRGTLSRDPALLDRMKVQGKSPKIALLIEVQDLWVRTSEALRGADPWSAPPPELPDLVPMAQVLSEHIRKNKARGLSAKIMRAVASPKLVASSLRHDYKKRKY